MCIRDRYNPVAISATVSLGAAQKKKNIQRTKNKVLNVTIIMFFGNSFDNFMPNKGGMINSNNKLKIDLKV